MRWILAIGVVALMGCTPQIPPSQLELPATTLMKKPEALPEIKVGDNIAVDDLKVRNVCKITTSKLIRLQRYIHTIAKR